MAMATALDTSLLDPSRLRHQIAQFPADAAVAGDGLLDQLRRQLQTGRADIQAYFEAGGSAVDGALITSREPKDIPQFVQALVAHLQHHPEAQRSALMQSPLPRQSGAPSPSPGLPTAADFDALVPASSAEQHSPQAALPPQPSVPQPGSTPTSDQ